MEEFKFYQTYYFCNAINNIVRDQFTYARNLNDFYGDGRIFNFISKFEKESIFHEFIYFVVSNIYDEHLDEFDLNNLQALPIERAFEYYEIAYTSFKDWRTQNCAHNLEIEHAYDDYMDYLRIDDSYSLLLKKTTDEIFYILFQNRELLMIFNQMLADNFEIENTVDCPEEVQPFLTKKGVIKRQHIPVWVKKAVYFRDRGTCVLCNKDLSGLLKLGNQENYDHIVPLARFGFNEVTNIQLLCSTCNLKKLAGKAITSGKTEPWFN